MTRMEEKSPVSSEVGAAFRNGETVNLITALRRERPQTQWGYVHVGPALLEEAADRLERLEAERDEARKLAADLSGMTADKLAEVLFGGDVSALYRETEKEPA